MAKLDRLTVYNTMLDVGLVPLFYSDDLELAKGLVGACAAEGARVVEFTNRGDRAWTVFTELAAWTASEHPEVALGVGSVLDGATAALFIASGADFVVSPILSEEASLVCNRRKVAYLPGCGSVSEISRAEELGAEIVKVFPAGQVGGPAFVKSVLGPMPWTRIMPSGGVDLTEESIGAWLRAGAACVGMGSQLLTGKLLKARDLDGVRANVREALTFVAAARQAS
jgi:2-dehydro-3-deoxyphosphogluconate aldolase / (4S)-4-hydroxy-2-oxoglutarate aldolase